MINDELRVVFFFISQYHCQYILIALSTWRWHLTASQWTNYNPLIWKSPKSHQIFVPTADPWQLQDQKKILWSNDDVWRSTKDALRSCACDARNFSNAIKNRKFESERFIEFVLRLSKEEFIVSRLRWKNDRDDTFMRRSTFERK